MTFVTTGLLVAGIAAMAVPILIHLLARQRRRPIEWGAMRFLMQALRRQRRRLQLEQLLLLAIRCLVLLLLGAALARPFLESAGLLESGGARTVFLVIDDGLAAGARTGEQRTALEDTVDLAVRVVDSLGPGDSVGVITAARPARGLVIPPSSDRRAIVDLLRSLEPAEAPTDLAAALPVLRGALDELGPDAERAVVYLLSEFRAGSAPLEQALPAVLAGDITPTLLAASAARQRLPNVQVTSIEPLRGLVLSAGEDGTGQVTVSLARCGGELPRDVSRIRLRAEGLPPIEPKTVEWDPGQLQAQVDFVVNLGGRGDGGVTLSASIDDDTLPADNVRHTVLVSRSRVRVLIVGRRTFGADPDLDRLHGAQWVQRALQPSERSPVDVVEVDPAALDPVDVRGIDAAVLTRPDLVGETGWAALRHFVDTGGLLIVLPPGPSTVHPWTDTLAEALDLPWRIGLEVVEHEPGLGLAAEQPVSELLRLLSGDLGELTRPVTAWRVLPVDTAQTQADHVLSFADGSPLAISGAPQGDEATGAGGLVVYLAVSPDLDWTNLPSQPLMVPLFHEMIKQGIGLIRTSQRYAVGEQPPLGLGAAAASLMDPRGRTLTIRTDGRPSEPLSSAGLYGVLDHGAQEIGTVAVNVEPAAGRTDPQEQAAVTEWLGKAGAWEIFDAGDPSAALRTADSGAPLAGLLLLAVLALVVVETALARWFSHAQPGRRSPLTESPLIAEGAAASAIAPHGG